MRRKNFEHLKKHILPRSEEKSDFNLAKKEWALERVYVTEGKCPCTQNIMEHCVIKNKLNGNETFVGNICVGRFMDIDARKLFTGLKKLQKNAEAKPNRDLIDYAAREKILKLKDIVFLRSILNFKKLSDNQKGWLLDVNHRILKGIVVRQLLNGNISNDLNSSNVTCDEESNNATGNQRRYHDISIGSDAQYDQESEDETTTDAEDDSDFEVDETESEDTGDDTASNATSESDNDFEGDSETDDTDDTDDSFNFHQNKRLKIF